MEQRRLQFANKAEEFVEHIAKQEEALYAVEGYGSVVSMFWVLFSDFVYILPTHYLCTLSRFVCYREEAQDAVSALERCYDDGNKEKVRCLRSTPHGDRSPQTNHPTSHTTKFCRNC